MGEIPFFGNEDSKLLRVLMFVAHKISVHGAYLCILK